MRTAEKLNKELRDLWTIEDLCEALSITPVTVQTWRKERDLPTVVLPGTLRDAIRFVPEEIKAWAARRKRRVHGKIVRLTLQAA